MNFQLTFLDDARHAREVWEADFEAEHTAICWMWIVGGVWALKRDWSMMELWCRRCRPGRVATCPRSSLWDARMLYRADSGERPEAIQQIGTAATARKTTHPYRGT